MIELSRQQVADEFSDVDYHLAFTVYGKNGVMGDLEPVKEITSHELGIAIEGIADSAEVAEAVTLYATRQLFYARLPEVKGTAGTAAFVTDEVLPATTSYRWTMNHIVPVDDPMSLFDLHLVDVGSEALQPTLQPQA